MRQRMTVADALKHARHDFLNDLQLIKMHADLGNIENISGIIDEISEMARQYSVLNRLGLPETEEWLLTAAWRFPELPIGLACHARKAPKKLDVRLASFLEMLFSAIVRQLDPETETECHVSLLSDETGFELKVTVTHKGTGFEWPEIPEGLPLRKACRPDATEWIVAVQMEG